MRARELMTANPVFVTPNEPVSRAAEIMRDSEIGIVPVVDDVRAKHLIGVITDRDIAVRCVAAMHLPACQVRIHMTRERLHTVSPDDDVHQVLEVMAHDQLRRVPVVSEGDRLEGMISQADIARRLGAQVPLEVERVLESVSADRGRAD